MGCLLSSCVGKVEIARPCTGILGWIIIQKWYNYMTVAGVVQKSTLLIMEDSSFKTMLNSPVGIEGIDVKGCSLCGNNFYWYFSTVW